MEVSGRLHAPTALPLGKNRDSRWIGAWVGFDTGVKVWEKKKSLVPAGIRTSHRTVCSLVSIVTELSPLYVRKSLNRKIT